MGIKTLLPNLKKIEKVVHLSSYRGQILGIDAYSWLHKSVSTCSRELALGLPTITYLNYLKRWLDLFKLYEVTPYLIFDGQTLKMKEKIEIMRERERTVKLDLAKMCEEKNDKHYADKYFRGAVEVTHEMAYEFIKELRIRRIKYIVAPYEADAQLAYLAKKKIIDAVVTEDSDLLAFGCPKVIFKLNLEGEGIEINFKDLPKVTSFGEAIGSSERRFRHFCILSGCDYLPSIPQIGSAKALTFIKCNPNYLEAIRSIRMSLRYDVPDHYEREFYKADLTFCYMRVYDPYLDKLVSVNEPPVGFPLDELEFLGKPIKDPKFLLGLVSGEIHPKTHQRMSNDDYILEDPALLPSPFKGEVYLSEKVQLDVIKKFSRSFHSKFHSQTYPRKRKMKFEVRTKFNPFGEMQHEEIVPYQPNYIKAEIPLSEVLKNCKPKYKFMFENLDDKPLKISLPYKRPINQVSPSSIISNSSTDNSTINDNDINNINFNEEETLRIHLPKKRSNFN